MAQYFITIVWTSDGLIQCYMYSSPHLSLLTHWHLRDLDEILKISGGIIPENRESIIEMFIQVRSS